MAKKTFRPGKFMLSAVSKDETREFMNHAYYDKAAHAIVSTDGRQMHIWWNPPFEHATDTYVIFNGDTPVAFNFPGYSAYIDGGTSPYPKWQKVIPVDGAWGESDKAQFAHPETSIPVFCAKHSTAVNYTFLKNLQEAEWTVKFPKATRSVSSLRFDYENFTAIMCPLRLDV